MLSIKLTEMTGYNSANRKSACNERSDEWMLTGSLDNQIWHFIRLDSQFWSLYIDLQASVTLTEWREPNAD